MSKFTYVAAGVGVLILIGFGLYSMQAAPKKDLGTITIGAVLSLTGDAAHDATEIQRGMELAKDDLTARGVKVNIVYEDDNTDSKKTLSALQKLAAVDKPDFIVGFTWSFMVDTVASALDTLNIPAYTPTNTSEYTTPSKNLFYGASKNTLREKAIATWLKENNKKKIAIIIDKEPWGESNATAFKAAAKDAGAQVVFEDSMPPFDSGATIIPTMIAKLKTAGADVILFSGFPDPIAILMNKSQELGLKLPILFASSAPFGVIKNGVSTVHPGDEFYAMTTAVDNAFAQKYQAKFGVAPAEYADRAYDGVMLMVEGLEKKADGQSLVDYMHTKTNYKGYGTTYKFDERGDITAVDWQVVKLK